MDYNFNRVSDRYDQTRALPPGVPERICQWVLSRLPKDPAITEFGVGTGRIAIPFILKGISFTGLDISDQMLSQAREKLGGNQHRSRLLLSDITQPLPIADTSQDAILAVHILHLVDATAALHQARRILKPHGSLVWGYEHYADHSPKAAIRRYFHETTAALGHERRRQFHVPEARRLLAEWGAAASQHVVAVWPEQATARQMLEGMSSRTLSSSWELSEEVLQESIRRTAKWAAEQFGNLDRVLENEQSFVVDWYQF